MASIERKMSDGRKRCVAVGPNAESCRNMEHTPSGSIHHFCLREKEPSRYMQWVRFVRRHAPKWTPRNKQAILCGIIFEESCFTVNCSIAKNLGMKAMLKPDSVPTIDTANEMKEKARHPGSEHRKLNRDPS